ncbi:bifunctional ADP-heptose synthase [Saprospiraceae bacterium]|jgi:rfaE bifunctional protein kinase chain/domain|nr:bifunctional ADP-heptose synthase [bacterium]MDB4539369.1 bifunctional ADP-heptose synthase [Saprospiraceae bacterium]MDC3210403.1 bifunctional ADP-heptose synthase [Saprospiraceae bacterium]MDC3219803.1 bifunctional ADP-heptose synthase [Saprospiraceae bacterium]MDG1434212.1 bifunctional ADP-heptose synthase [Saprospiraceae bacterium]
MDANQLFKAFNNINIAIIGDVIIDRYLNGNVDRISPEAPVPIIHLKREDNRLGGSGNVALNIKAMGATPFLFSVIGDDENGEIFKKLMPENNLWQNGILRSKERCTTVKTRVMANNQQLLRVDREDTIDLSKSEEDNFINKIKTFLAGQNIDVIILQDYNKGVLSLPVISKILSLAEKNEIPIVVDPKKVNFLAYKNVEIFKPNLKEIQESTPFQVLPNLDSLKKASEFLRKKSGAKNTIITLSEKGMFIDDGQNIEIIPTQIRNITDVCGAGDSVISLTALGLAIKLELNEIAKLANLAGGQVCEKVGVVPVDKNQLKQEFKEL